MRIVQHYISQRVKLFCIMSGTGVNEHEQYGNCVVKSGNSYVWGLYGKGCRLTWHVYNFDKMLEKKKLSLLTAGDDEYSVTQNTMTDIARAHYHEHDMSTWKLLPLCPTIIFHYIGMDFVWGQLLQGLFTIWNIRRNTDTKVYFQTKVERYCDVWYGP